MLQEYGEIVNITRKALEFCPYEIDETIWEITDDDDVTEIVKTSREVDEVRKHFKYFQKVREIIIDSQIVKLYLSLSLSLSLRERERADTIITREYQDLEFFPDQLQTFIERCIGPQRFQM